MIANKVKNKVKFNPFSAEFRANPYPTYDRLRVEDPIHWSFLKAWVVTRHRDVKQILSDRRFIADDLPERLNQKKLYLQDGEDFNLLKQTISKWLFFVEPPLHNRLREIMTKAFSVSTIEKMRPRVTEIVDELINDAREVGEMDIIAGMAAPLPALVTAKMLGIPDQDRLLITQWAYDLFRVFDQPLSLQDYADLNLVAGECREYFLELINHRKNNLQSDLLSNLIIASEETGKLDLDEVLGLCAMLFSVGQETTENLIGNGMLALLQHPEQMAKLQQDPTLIKNAVEELLRYDSPVQIVARDATEDIEIDGNLIHAGESVVLCLGAANRDPEQFRDPDILDITRKINRNLPFGGGIHYCLGSALARLEGQIAINAIVQQLPELTLATNSLTRRKNIVLRGLQSLPVTFNVASLLKAEV
ncbi:MAG: cytochrome P450 [Cyanobacteria bacterium P01_F01_bin.143]